MVKLHLTRYQGDTGAAAATWKEPGVDVQEQGREAGRTSWAGCQESAGPPPGTADPRTGLSWPDSCSSYVCSDSFSFLPATSAPSGSPYRALMSMAFCEIVC